MARRRIALTFTASVGVLALVGATAAQANPSPDSSTPTKTAGTYIVQVKGDPVASYDGGVRGYAATRPSKGESINPKSSDVKRYRGLLEDRRQRVLGEVPDAEPIYSYDTAFNGFAAELTSAEAAELADMPGVVHIWKNEIHELDTISTPDFLGLTGKDGVWNDKFGGQEHAGEGVIVGVVDSGIWPENPAFAALPEPRPDADVIAEKWNGTCSEGNDTPENNVECNNKLIGADYFGEGIDPIEGEFESPRDYGGHGTHTSSTAAGNMGVEAVIRGETIGTMSGMAPAARIAMYKACWETEGDGGCASIDLLAAVNQAVSDGVDVINYSISGSASSIVGPVEIAFYNAARAGVFVAASAGNSGGVSTTNHNSPWVTTVAASTHDRAYRASVTLGDGTTITGAGLGDAVPETDLVLSSEVAAPDADPADARICTPGSLDASAVEGKVVACARGTIARVDKSKAVKQAGGVGMIHYNTSPASNDIAADFHYVPTVHVKLEYQDEIEAYAASDGATASLSAGERYKARAPQMAAFSSTGPAIAGNGDLLKPDITAPGVGVVAAVAPPGNGGENFASYQGTSMSSPHIAGLGALLAGEHPEWQPMWIKSALMTTATTVDNQGKPIQRGGEDATPFDFGAGHVDPAAAFEPGLVYDSGPADWIAYMCAIGQGQLVGAPCDDVPSIDPSDLNYPSIAIGDLAGTQTVTRTVTNATDGYSFYRAKVDAPDGLDVTVSPRAMVLRPGQSKEVRIEVEREDAAFDEYTNGSVTWVGFTLDRGRGPRASVSELKSKSPEFFRGERWHKTTVRSPLVVQPVAISAPGEARGEGASGSTELEVTPGYTGTLAATAAGLEADTVTTLPLQNPDGSSFPTDDPQTNEHVGKVEVTVPEGAEFARFATFDSDYADLGAGTDVDLFVYRETADGLVFVGYSASGGSTEAVTMNQPGNYQVFVDLWALPPDHTSADVLHHHWVVGDASGNLTVSPESQQVSIAEPASVTAEWSGLEAGTRYLGAVLYGDGESTVGRTILSITG